MLEDETPRHRRDLHPYAELCQRDRGCSIHGRGGGTTSGGASRLGVKPAARSELWHAGSALGYPCAQNPGGWAESELCGLEPDS